MDKRRIKDRDNDRIRRKYGWLWNVLKEYELDIHHEVYHDDNEDTDWIYDLCFCTRAEHNRIHHKGNIGQGAGTKKPTLVGNKHNSRKVLNITDGIVYDSVEDGARSVGLKGGESISRCCKGKLKTAGGKEWCYYDE